MVSQRRSANWDHFSCVRLTNILLFEGTAVGMQIHLLISVRVICSSPLGKGLWEHQLEMLSFGIWMAVLLVDPIDIEQGLLRVSHWHYIMTDPDCTRYTKIRVLCSPGLLQNLTVKIFLNSWSTCLYFPNARIMGLLHSAWLHCIVLKNQNIDLAWWHAPLMLAQQSRTHKASDFCGHLHSHATFPPDPDTYNTNLKEQNTGSCSRTLGSS